MFDRVKENTRMIEHIGTTPNDAAKLAVLVDISKSLAVIADNISKDTIKVEIANKQSPINPNNVNPIEVSIVNPIRHTSF